MSDKLREQIRTDILSLPLDICASKWVLEPVPYLFSEHGAESFWDWKRSLAEAITVDAKNILITGSAAAGISLNPHKSLRAFDSASDIDIAVISTHHFDVSWRTLRQLGAKRYSLTKEIQSAVREHVRRYIYWGTIATDRILPVLPFASKWTEALELVNRHPMIGDRVIGFRIYRDYASLRSYTMDGLRKLRDNLIDDPKAQSEPIK